MKKLTTQMTAYELELLCCIRRHFYTLLEQPIVDSLINFMSIAKTVFTVLLYSMCI